MTNDAIKELVRQLIEGDLDEKNRKAALEWLEKRTDAYQAMVDLGLIAD